MKRRVDRSRGIETLITESLSKINPIDPLGYTNQTCEDNEIDQILVKGKHKKMWYRRPEETTRDMKTIGVWTVMIQSPEVQGFGPDRVF